MIKIRRTKRTFSPEFKLEAVEQIVKYPRDSRGAAGSWAIRQMLRQSGVDAGRWLARRLAGMRTDKPSTR